MWKTIIKNTRSKHSECYIVKMLRRRNQAREGAGAVVWGVTLSIEASGLRLRSAPKVITGVTLYADIWRKAHQARQRESPMCSGIASELGAE